MISFGQAAYLGIGATLPGLLLIEHRRIVVLGRAGRGAVGGALAALLIGYFCVRRTHIYFAILTLAFGHLVYLIAFKWYGFTGGDNGLIGIPVPAWIAEPSFANYYKFVLVITVVAIYLLWRIVNSPFGKALTAIRENPERADFIGIPVDRTGSMPSSWSALLRPAGARSCQRSQRLSRLAHWTQSIPGAADGPAGRRLHLLSARSWARCCCAPLPR